MGDSNYEWEGHPFHRSDGNQRSGGGTHFTLVVRGEGIQSRRGCHFISMVMGNTNSGWKGTAISYMWCGVI